MDSSLAVVVAHFHPQGLLAQNLFELVRHLATRTRSLVFVSTGLAQAEAARLSPFAKVIVRDNVGYDFWSYRTGIDALGGLEGIERLVLFNSSFVTFDPLKLSTAYLTPVDGPALRGLTASHECGMRHAQSYWVAFEDSTLIRSADFRRWWADMEPVSDRSQVIFRYELGMSSRFSAIGVPVRSAFEPSTEDLLIASCRALEMRIWRISDPQRQVTLDVELARQLNPSLYLWDVILARFGILKRSLLVKPELPLNLTPLLSQARESPALRALLEDAVR